MSDVATPAAVNPANAPLARVTEATRIPMNLPTLKLEMPEIPGYYLYWHLGKNVPKAVKAGYEFVDESEVNVVNTGLADNRAASGSTDLGSRVSIIAGSAEEGASDPQRFYLMKLRNEWHEADEKAFEAVNERVAAALRGGRMTGAGAPDETEVDRLKKYLKKGQDLFIPKRR